MPRFEVPCFQTRVFKTGVKVASRRNWRSYLIIYILLVTLHNHLNPKQAGTFGLSMGRGGVESTHHGFRAPVYLISLQIIQKWSQMKAGIFIYM